MKLLLIFACWSCAVLGLDAAGLQRILDSPRHLGAAGQPEWSIFEGKEPHGTNLSLTFDLSGEFARVHTLFIRQDDVKQEWTVTLNGRRLGTLFQMEAPLVHTLNIPAGALKQTGNRLEISPRQIEDVVIREISIARGTNEELLGKHALDVLVRELGPGQPFPGRITIVDHAGSLAALHDFAATNLAARPGVVYTSTGRARVGLLPGRYTLYASRGPEYGMEFEEISVPSDEVVDFALAREVDTSGWVAADTHIHTLTLSKHGDSTLRERVITIAGEGIEMPVVTEHNLHADYSAAAQRAGLDKYFTAVAGNEVTTRKGHLNIFPVDPAADEPDHTIENTPELLNAVRKVPGVQVVVLNHPMDVHSGFTPLAATNINPITGKLLRGDFHLGFDAMEVINSGAMRSDWMEPFNVWFALLNRGLKITAVGASDSHDVSRYIVGQGRTYIRGNDADPAGLNPKELCANLKQGRAVVSLGMFAHLALRETAADAAPVGPGEMLSPRTDEIEMIGTFAAPSWINPTHADIYANGRELAVYRFSGLENQPKNVDFRFRLPRPKQDTWYVLIAQARGITNLFWSVARPYQPTSKRWEPTMLGATNPVWLDADADGKFTSPREHAQRLAALPRAQMLEEIAKFDWAFATQLAELLQEKGEDLSALATSLPPPARQAFNDYLKSLPK